MLNSQNEARAGLFYSQLICKCGSYLQGPTLLIYINKKFTQNKAIPLTCDRRTIITCLNPRIMGKSPDLQHRHPEETVTTVVRSRGRRRKPQLSAASRETRMLFKLDKVFQHNRSEVHPCVDSRGEANEVKKEKHPVTRRQKYFLVFFDVGQKYCTERISPSIPLFLSLSFMC